MKSNRQSRDPNKQNNATGGSSDRRRGNKTSSVKRKTERGVEPRPKRGPGAPLISILA